MLSHVTNVQNINDDNSLVYFFFVFIFFVLS
jgi:hypothetical protein